MEITYTPATACDIEALYRFNKELIDTYENTATIAYDRVLQWVRQKLETQIGEYTRITVGGEVAGYFHFSPDGEEMELDDFYLFPAWRGLGIGTEVLRRCIEQTECSIVLCVFVQNEGAIRLYRRMGFEIVETISETRCLMKRQREHLGSFSDENREKIRKR